MKRFLGYQVVTIWSGEQMWALNVLCTSDYVNTVSMFFSSSWFVYLPRQYRMYCCNKRKLYSFSIQNLNWIHEMSDLQTTMNTSGDCVNTYYIIPCVFNTWRTVWSSDYSEYKCELFEDIFYDLLSLLYSYVEHKCLFQTLNDVERLCPIKGWNVSADIFCRHTSYKKR